VKTDNNIYKEQGYKNRKDYLNYLSETYGIEEHIVFELADLLGENEDFDGLLTGLEDYGVY